MNQNQKVVLIAVAVIVAGMLLYPPFEWVEGGSRGFYPIYDAPLSSSIDVAQLVVQWIGVLIVGMIAWILAK
jgi:hypothetical protein